MGIGTASILRFECPTSRGITYWIEPLPILLLFCKEKQSNIVFAGATYHSLDNSVDAMRGVLIHSILNKRFGADNLIKIDLKKRAVAPSGGGEVRLSVQNLIALKTINMTQPGQIKKVRGLCYTISVAPSLANRV